MCHFMFMSFRDGPRWALMGLVVKLTQSVSLRNFFLPAPLADFRLTAARLA